MLRNKFSKPSWLPRPVLWGGAGVMLVCNLALAQPELNQPGPPAVAQPVPETPAPAEQLSGFELIEKSAETIRRLVQFQDSRGLQTTDLQGRTNRAADEIEKLIGGLEMLMEQEAERIYDRAMKSEPEERDRLLNRLIDLNQPQLDVRNRAERELARRTVGETVYPTLEEAEEARRKLEEEQRRRREEIEQEDLEELEKLKREILGEQISEAAERFAEEDGRRMLEAAMRLVLPQRRVQLNELVRKYPDTQAAAEAGRILAAIDRENELVAGHKLNKALHSPVLFDQRWRRLKEIQRDHPKTAAAAEAGRIFAGHVAQVPPVLISNHTAAEVEMTVDRPYSVLEEVELAAGESRTFTSAFPLMIRVEVRNDEWDVYRVWPGGNFILQTALGVPVLCPVPAESGTPIIQPLVPLTPTPVPANPPEEKAQEMNAK